MRKICGLEDICVCLQGAGRVKDSENLKTQERDMIMIQVKFLVVRAGDGR